MQFKHLSLLAVALLVPSASSCVQYSGIEYCDDEYMQEATITDNGQQVCSFSGELASDGLYHYTCFQGNYAALQQQCNGVVEYANPGGNYAFQATGTATGGDGIVSWQASEYGC